MSSERVTALLEGYEQTWRVADELPSLIWLRRGGRPLVARLPVPRFRPLFLRLFLTHHMRGRVSDLQRAYEARAAIEGEAAYERELKALEHYAASLPTIPYRRFVTGVTLAVLVAAYIVATVLDFEEKRLLGTLSKAVLELDAPAALGAGSESLAMLFGVAFLCFVSLYALLALPMTAFRLKRLLLNLYPNSTQHEIRAARTSAQLTRRTGLYLQEDELFRSLARKPALELPFDLIPRVGVLGAVLIVAVFGFGAVFAGKPPFDTSDGVMIGCLLCAWIAAAGVAGNLVLVSIGRRRNAMPRSRAEGSTTRLAAIWRRVLAAAIDSLFVAAIAILFIWSGLLPFTFALLLAPPVGALVSCAPFAGRRGRRRGQTLGKQLLSIRATRYDGTKLDVLRTVFREVVLKWGALFGLAAPAFFVPSAFNVLRPLWAHASRTVHDVLAGTVVVDVSRPPSSGSGSV